MMWQQISALQTQQTAILEALTQLTSALRQPQQHAAPNVVGTPSSSGSGQLERNQVDSPIPRKKKGKIIAGVNRRKKDGVGIPAMVPPPTDITSVSSI